MSPQYPVNQPVISDLVGTTPLFVGVIFVGPFIFSEEIISFLNTKETFWWWKGEACDKEDWKWKVLAKNSLFACYHIGMPNPGGTTVQFTSHLFSIWEPEVDTNSLVLWRGSRMFLLGGDCFEHLKECNVEFTELIQTMQQDILRIPRGLWRRLLSKIWSQLIGNGYRNPWYNKGFSARLGSL